MIWNISDLVELKSGGPAMTVVAVTPREGGSSECQCEWFDKDDKLNRKTFKAEALKKYEDPRYV